MFRYAAILLALSPAWAQLPPTEGRPLQVREGTVRSQHGYVSSNACLSCHPDQYSSWHRSYHRTMTQVDSTKISWVAVQTTLACSCLPWVSVPSSAR